MTDVSWIGFAAASCTTLAFVPQVLHTWRTRSTHDISLAMFLTMTVGVLLWLIYGLYIHNMPIVLANGTTFLLSLTILVFKLRT